MKKIYFLLMLCSVTLWSCKQTIVDEPDPKPDDSTNVYVPLTEWEKVDSIYTVDNYTVPSHTMLKIAIQNCASDPSEANIKAMYDQVEKLVPKEEPYNMIVNINGDPHTRMGFNWFTNDGITEGEVQIIAKVLVLYLSS